MSSSTVLVNASKIPTFNKRKIMKNTIAKTAAMMILKFGLARFLTTKLTSLHRNLGMHGLNTLTLTMVLLMLMAGLVLREAGEMATS